MRWRERAHRIEAHLERGDKLLEEIRDLGVEIRELREESRREFGLNREESRREFELNRQEFELNRKQAEHNRRESQNTREVLRELVADIPAQREESRRHNEAVVGALTDLAAEIRSWGGGAAPATG